MHILIFGGSGYVGSTLCDILLSCGYQVRVLDNCHKGNSDALIPYSVYPNFEFVFGDITNKKDVDKVIKNVDAIIHLSAVVGFPACSKNPELSRIVNVEGTRNICEAKPKNVPLFFASTGSVYGKVENLCTEDTPTNPQSTYGIHKLEAEKIVLNTPNTFVYRFATAFGVSPCMRVNLLINDLTYRAYTEKSLVIFQADFKRSFIHVEEMGLSFLYGLQRLNENSQYRLFNVGCPDNNVSKKDVAELIKSKTGCLVIYEDIAEDADQRSYEVDFSRFKQSIGWLPSKSVSDGIDEILKVCPILQTRNPYI